MLCGLLPLAARVCMVSVLQCFRQCKPNKQMVPDFPLAPSADVKESER